MGSGAFALAAFCFLGAALSGQTDLATVRGTATDPTGAVAPKVNISRETATNENGDFQIPYVALGTYRLTARAPGFKNFVANDVTIRARETRRVEVVLELGAVGAEVTVVGGTATIATEGSQIAGGFNREAWVVRGVTLVNA